MSLLGIFFHFLYKLSVGIVGSDIFKAIYKSLQVSKFKDRKEMLGNKQVDLIILLEEPTTLANQFSQLVQSGT